MTQSIHSFVLPAVMTIETVAALAEELKQLPAGVVTLDGSKTEILTTPGVQLLLSLQKNLSDAGGKLVLTQSQPIFTSAFAALGLTPQLNLMEQQ